MKRSHLILYLLINSVLVFAQSSISDLYKQWIVEDINRGQYTKVVSMIDKVEDWEYSPNEQTPYIDTEKFNALMHYVGELSNPPQNIDSLIMYYSEELYRMAHYYMRLSQYDIALELCAGVSQIRENTLGDNNPLTTIVWGDLGLIYLQMGDLGKSEYYLLKANNNLLETVGRNHPYYVSMLNCLGMLAEEKGLYLQAEQYYMQEMQLVESLYGRNSSSYGIAISNLAHIYEEIGDYERAFDMYVQCLQIIIDNDGRDNLSYAKAIINLGMCCKNFGWYSEAEEWLSISLPIFLEQAGEQSLLYANALQDYGVVLCALNRKEEAENYCLKALEIREKSGNTYECISSLRTLAVIAEETNQDYRKAEQYWLRALELSQNAHSEYGDLNYADLLANITTFYLDANIFAEALRFHSMSYNLYHEICKNIFLRGSESQRMMFWRTIAGYYYKIFPNFYYKYYKQDKISRMAYNNELFSKGLLLNSSESIKRSIFESNDTALIDQWNELTNIKQTIQVLQEKSPQVTDMKEYHDRAEHLEKEITKSSATYRENQIVWQISWDSVRNHLSPNQVAIEYMVAPLNEDSIVYCAILLRDTCSYPIMIPLFNESEVKSLINTEVDSATNRTYGYNYRGRILSQKVWSKILPYVKQGETIYFAPSGLLHQLAIEALPYDSTHTMADMYNLVRLSSTREIVTRKQETQHSSAVLYGGIQYDMDTTIIKKESAKYPEIAIKRSIENDTINRGKIGFLEWTQTEVENINSMLKQNHLQVQLFTSTNANEESFKALSGKHQNILHIATHGFFWSDSTAKRKDYFSQRIKTLDNNMPSPPTIDPLNRCGLLFAGAQMAWSGHSTELPDGVQDGILTAKEISLLNLRDADLVVLSACETGKGEITGDGVFGLQRAFKQAGAQTIIMSLWPVNDIATQLLMTEFYRNWIISNQSKREAFRNAQNSVRSKYQKPVYWAGFIMLD